MNFANRLTTILLLLLTFLLTTIAPTITTTPLDSNGGQAKIIPQRWRQQQQMFSAPLVQQASLDLASAGTDFFLPHKTVALDSANVPINTANQSYYYSTLQRTGQKYKQQQHEQQLHQNQQEQQSNNINMLDFSGLVMGKVTLEQSEQLESITYPPPIFDFAMPRNVTTRSGQTAAINCRVEHLGDKSVSWIRKRDLHILTAGILTYTSDERFQVVRTADFKDWTLQVKYAQPRDAGIYECQVNTEPKISMAYRLNVIVTPPDAKAIIAGPSDLYVKVGSAITLTCHVKQPSSAPDIGPIYWYRANYMLTPFVAHPNEAAIDMLRISMESKLGEKLQSRLRIANAQPADSGNYTCMPTTAEAASVIVTIINDENPAAMQKSAAPCLESCWVILFLLAGLSTRRLTMFSSTSPQSMQHHRRSNKTIPGLKLACKTLTFGQIKCETNTEQNIYFRLLS